MHVRIPTFYGSLASLLGFFTSDVCRPISRANLFVLAFQDAFFCRTVSLSPYSESATLWERFFPFLAVVVRHRMNCLFVFGTSQLLHYSFTSRTSAVTKSVPLCAYLLLGSLDCSPLTIHRFSRFGTGPFHSLSSQIHKAFM